MWRRVATCRIGRRPGKGSWRDWGRGCRRSLRSTGATATWCGRNCNGCRAYLPFEPKAAHLFFQLVSRRYERGSFLITSNRTVSEWGVVFGDAIAATAILDRMLHHSHVITIRGDSYRLKDKRRAGALLQQPPVAAPSTIHQPA